MAIYKGVTDELPFPARLALAAIMLICLVMAFYFDAKFACLAFYGPLMIVNLLTARKMGKPMRTENPALFLGLMVAFIAITWLGLISIYERLTGSGV